jgi:D-aminoacyl-tRNA deacylase
VRAVVQRVSEAAVRVGADVRGRIGPGLLVLLGVGQGDGPADAAYLARKVAELRIFEDEQGKLNRAVVEAGGAVLVVSQFTLFGDCRGGRRPSFTGALPAEAARPLVEAVCAHLRARGLEVQSGVFGAAMDLALVNRGPVTLLLDSRKEF